MQNNIENTQPEFPLTAKIHDLLNKSKYEEAREVINTRLKDFSVETALTIEQLEYYGCLVDLGCESNNEQDLTNAISFLEANQTSIQQITGESSYYYNLANAKHGLDKIFWQNNPGVKPIETGKERFQEAINLYWQAFKTADRQNETLYVQVLINLSNALTYVSRIIEAIQFLDVSLNAFPNHPNALLSRGDALYYLCNYFNSNVTLSLYQQIYINNVQAILSDKLPVSYHEQVRARAAHALSFLEKHEYDLNKMQDDLAQTRAEYEALTAYRKFCVDNFLILCEHGIYCPCVAAESDDLQIGVSFAVFKGNLVPKLELLLNRLKSEFALARLNFYQSENSEFSNSDVLYSELGDGEIINTNTEMLRNSFRICYGILDKIALGICKLYELPARKVFFESFWSDTQTWSTLNQNKNIHLNALYSIACDLNTKTGELKHFKEWRNKLEHNLLILKLSSDSNIDVLHVLEDSSFVTVVDFEEFKEKTLHLLQLTRAAIFSYVFCARLQTIELPGNETDAPAFHVKFRS
jgi:tetratricopeptide (TPR) repeat protein